MSQGDLLQTEDDMLQKLLLQATEGTTSLDGLGVGPTPASRPVVPVPGFCLKTKTTDSNEKVFINICKGENLPEPRDISDEDLLKLLDSDDPSGFRIPMSLGEPHAELDKSGRGCTAYDVVVNPVFYQRVENRQILLGFFLTVVLEGLEYKYSLSLDRQWTMMKNRKFVGSLPEQNVRTQSKPLITDLADNSPGVQAAPPSKSLISEISGPTQESVRPKAPEPVYTILQEPPTGHPEFLVAEIHLPKVTSAATVSLDFGEDRIVLATRSNAYGLDVYLPYNIDQAECGAQFNRKTHVLSLTMPVLPL